MRPTYFFREPAHFELIEPEIASITGRAPKVWSATSSFGDEACTPLQAVGPGAFRKPAT
jgi:chemotaxis methyl-accepting protein methylase